MLCIDLLNYFLWFETIVHFFLIQGNFNILLRFIIYLFAINGTYIRYNTITVHIKDNEINDRSNKVAKSKTNKHKLRKKCVSSFLNGLKRKGISFFKTKNKL